MSRVGPVLKISIFATGCAGIVAEFVLSTLATYLLGNAVFQWTMVMSLMLFAMGLGSRLSKYFRHNLLDTFILIEFGLSLLCASSGVITYGLAAHTTQIVVLIYTLAMAIGLLIGLEIPLVTRLNNAYEELRINIASVMEKDYYGSLLGGFFFAFFALPRLGMTYTPIVLGGINFAVATLFVIFFFGLLRRQKIVVAVLGLCSLAIVGLALFAKPIVLYGEQRLYKDKIIFARQTRFQRIVITQFKEDHWLYINDQEQFSSFDEHLYHEPLVHPVMGLAARREHILVLGGGDGLALREIFKYEEVKTVTLVDLDPEMTKLAATHPVLVKLNRGAMQNEKLTIVNQDAKAFMRANDRYFDVIIIDLPDPDTIDLMHLYTSAFYHLIHRRLAAGGIMVTQATSPYFSRQAFLCIEKTVASAGFATLPYHNQIPTMGEWGWVLAAKGPRQTNAVLKKRMTALTFDGIPTRFLNREAAIAMVHFGKGIFDADPSEQIQINTESNPVLYRYYQQGTWAMY